MANQDRTLSDYIATLRRRKLPAIIVASTVALGFVYVTYTLPAVYQSEAVIIIEQQSLPSIVEPATTTMYPEQRIQEVRQRVVTTQNVAKIIEELGLYPELRGRAPMDDLVAQFRANTLVAPEVAPIVNRTSGRVAEATFAFSVIFNYRDPIITKVVTERLANLFLAESDRLGTEQATMTSEFLRAEAARLEHQLRDIERRMAEFKALNTGALPDNLNFNRETLQRLESQLADTENRLRLAREQQAIIESELTALPRRAPVVGSDGTLLPSATERLAVLQQELAALRGRYSEDHPDIVARKREIEALTGGADAGDRVAVLQAQLSAAEAELAAARQRYSENHPDVLRLQRSVAALQAQLAAQPAAAAQAAAAPNNPAYIQARARLDTVREEITAATAAREELIARIESYRGLLARSPEVERQYSDLMREYEVAATEYRELRANLRQAELAEEMRSGGHRGEVFSLLEAPRIPTSPVSPNRPSLVFLGLVVALTAGLVVVSLLEGIDSTVRGQKDMHAILEMPPLAIIPYIENRNDQRHRRRRLAALTVAFAGAVCLVFLSILLQSPA